MGGMSSTGGQGRQLYVNNTSGLVYQLQTKGVSGETTHSWSYPAFLNYSGSWVHITLTQNNTAITENAVKMYVNGEEVTPSYIAGESGATCIESNAELFFFGAPNSGSKSWKGRFDEIVLQTGSAWTAASVRGIYNGGYAWNLNETSVATAWWTCGDDRLPGSENYPYILRDRFNGYNLTQSNASMINSHVYINGIPQLPTASFLVHATEEGEQWNANFKSTKRINTISPQIGLRHVYFNLGPIGGGRNKYSEPLLGYVPPDGTIQGPLIEYSSSSGATKKSAAILPAINFPTISDLFGS